MFCIVNRAEFMAVVPQLPDNHCLSHHNKTNKRVNRMLNAFQNYDGTNPQFAQPENVQRVRRSAFIANQLREMIFTGALKPGDRLPTEEQLCKHFGVSRTTLRESVQMLRVSGLLDVTPGRGSFVCLPSLGDLLRDLALYGRYACTSDNEVMALRELLQVEVIRKACETGSDKKKKLHNFVVNHQASPEENEQTERQWNLMLAEIGGGKLVRTLLEALLNMTKTQRLAQFADSDHITRTMGMQIRLNSAVVEGDTAMACRMMSNYLGNKRNGGYAAA